MWQLGLRSLDISQHIYWEGDHVFLDNQKEFVIPTAIVIAIVIVFQLIQEVISVCTQNLANIFLEYSLEQELRVALLLSPVTFTLVFQKNLVCNEKDRRALADTIYMTGVVVGSTIMGMISHKEE